MRSRAALLELRANAAVDRVLVEDSQATGVEYTDANGDRHTVRAGVVVVAAGALNTPQVLLRSGLGNPAIGRHLGVHPVRLVYGLFDEPQDAHMVYPITAHAMAHQHDEDGGFVIEATTIQDPIAFATTLRDERGPLWGQRLVDAVRSFRHWSGVLAMVNDENNASVVVDDNGGERFEVDFQPVEHERLDAALDFSRKVLETAGATRVCWTGIASTHVQGSCRMGDDPARFGRRPQRRVARGAAALRRRRVARSADAVGEPVAHDHGARHAPRRPPRRRPTRIPRRMKAALLG